MTIRVLLIEDNLQISENIQRFLELERIHTDRAYDGETGRRSFCDHPYDCVLLDRMLPGIDGITLAKRIKERSDTPIIMITARGQLEDKLIGFETGVDDYLVKPFDLEELLARIKALLRRDSKFEIFTYKTITIDLTHRRVLKHGKEVSITIKEFYILETLLKAYGLPVSRADIIEAVRGDDDVFQNSGKLDVYISTLRKKLDKHLIQTVSGFGYKIEKG